MAQIRTTIPKPSTFALLSLGGAVFLAVKTRLMMFQIRGGVARKAC